MNFFVAAIVFIVVSSLFFWLALKRLIQHPRFNLFFWTSPGLLIAVFHGQSTILLAALLTYGLSAFCTKKLSYTPLQLFALGLSAFKPHFALLVPILLLKNKQIGPLVKIGIVTGVLCLVSFFIFGSETWIAFFKNSSYGQTILWKQSIEWYKMGSTFSALCLLGIAPPLATVLHFAYLIPTGYLFWQLKNPLYQLIGGFFFVLLISPYQFSYDQILLTPALLLWSMRGPRAFLLRDRMIVASLWIWPLLTLSLTKALHLQLLPFLIGIALYRLNQIDQQQDASQNDAGPSESPKPMLADP